MAFERFVDWIVARRRAVSRRMHVYHYAAYERSALTPPHGRARDARAGGRRLPAPRGARRSLPHRQAVAPRLDRQLLDQGDREALRVRAHGRRARAATSRSSASRSGSRRATTRSCEEVERYNEEDCRSTFALHEWLRSIRPAVDLPWRLPPAAPADGAERGDATPSVRRCGRAPRAPTEEGEPRAATRATSRLPPARGEARSGGRGSAGRSSTTTSSSRDRTAIGGLEWDGNPTGGRGRRAMRTGCRSRAQEHKIGRTAHDPAHGRASAFGSTTTHGHRHDPARRQARATSRCRGPHAGTADSQLGAPRGVVRFARAYADGDEARIRRSSPLLERRAAASAARLPTRWTPLSRSGRATCSCRGRRAPARRGRARAWRSR